MLTTRLHRFHEKSQIEQGKVFKQERKRYTARCVLHVPEYLRVKQMMRKGKGVEGKREKWVIGNVDVFTGIFTTKNIQICIYTNLYS